MQCCVCVILSCRRKLQGRPPPPPTGPEPGPPGTGPRQKALAAPQVGVELLERAEGESEARSELVILWPPIIPLNQTPSMCENTLTGERVAAGAGADGASPQLPLEAPHLAGLGFHLVSRTMVPEGPPTAVTSPVGPGGLFLSVFFKRGETEAWRHPSYLILTSSHRHPFPGVLCLRALRPPHPPTARNHPIFQSWKLRPAHCPLEAPLWLAYS